MPDQDVSEAAVTTASLPIEGPNRAPKALTAFVACYALALLTAGLWVGFQYWEAGAPERAVEKHYYQALSCRENHGVIYPETPTHPPGKCTVPAGKKKKKCTPAPTTINYICVKD